MPAGAIPPLKDFAGVNLRDVARSIDAHELAWAKNVWGPERGFLEQRAALIESGYSLAAPAAWRHTGLMPFVDAQGTFHLIAANEINQAVEISGGVEKEILSAGYGIGVPGRPGWIVWKHELFVLHGPGEGSPSCGTRLSGLKSQSFVGVPYLLADDLGEAWTEWKPKPTMGVLYRRRHLVMAGMARPEESTLTWAGFYDNDKPTELQLVQRAKEVWIGHGDGDAIVGLAAVPVVGGATEVEEYLLIFKQHSTWMLEGDLPDVNTDPDPTNPSPRVHVWSQKAGLASKETLAWSELGLIWASNDNVWIAPRGGLPVAIGDAISPMLRAAPAGLRQNWCAVFHRDHYCLAIVSPDNANDGWPDQQWWCDLRDLAKPRWWGPQTIRCGGMHVLALPGQPDRLLSTYGYGQFLELPDDPGAAPENFDASDGPTDRLETEVRFKEFDGGDPFIQKLVDAVELSVWTSQDQVFTLDMLGDGGGAETQSRGVAGTAAGFVLGVGVLDTTQLAKQYQAIASFPPGARRFIAKTWQPRLTTTRANGAYPYSLAALGFRLRPIGRRPS